MPSNPIPARLQFIKFMFDQYIKLQLDRKIWYNLFAASRTALFQFLACRFNYGEIADIYSNLMQLWPKQQSIVM